MFLSCFYVVFMCIQNKQLSRMDNLENRLDMVLESLRQQSFTKWPFSNKHKCNIKRLAEAGFFWTGTVKKPNSAQCFVCNKELTDWKSSDEPWVEHRKHAPDCPFVIIGKSEEFLTLYQLRDLWFKIVKTCMHQIFVQQKKQFLTTAEIVKSNMTANIKRLHVSK